MSIEQTKNKDVKYRSDELAIIRTEEFPALTTNPIDAIAPDDYSRIEKLASWFVLRAPLSGITRLSNPSCIHMFKSLELPEKGSRTEDRHKFESTFLAPKQIDCTYFDFIYRRRAVKPSLEDLDLASNSDSVFLNPTERAVIFVGKNENNKEDSCIESVCRHVRNGFAHGRIALKRIKNEPYLFIEDGSNPSRVEYVGQKPKGPLLEVRFRMLVKLSTLEKWYKTLLSNNASEIN